MRSQLFDSALVGPANEALDFIGNILESSIEHSIIGKDMEGKILLRNEGARPAEGVQPGRSSRPSLTLPCCTFRRTRLETFPLACTWVSLPNSKRALRGFIPTHGLETW